LTDKITELLAELSAAAKPKGPPRRWANYEDHPAGASWATHAESIVMNEFMLPYEPDDETPAALTLAVEEARVKLRGALAVQHIERREKVRNAKLRTDAENEIKGTAYAYPSWVANFLKEHSLD
jgi:hypothetical protein